MNRKGLALLASLAALVAGCGSTHTITHVRVVHAHPCATAARMNLCAADIARASASVNGGDPAKVRVRCRATKTVRRWRCLIELPQMGVVNCIDATIRESGRMGVPLIGNEGGVVNMKRCNAVFGKS